jgi:hypothetical protein
MTRPITGQILYPQGHGFFEQLAREPAFQEIADWDSTALTRMSKQELESLLAEKDVSLLFGKLCFDAYQVVHHRSLDSHFLHYIDLVTYERNQLWGQSVFSQVFHSILLQSIQNQDYKGAVIFLGQSPLVQPVIDVLAGFGFGDFDFLQLPTEKSATSQFDQSKTGLLGVKISAVDSAAFIQSQKEYSFCFVMQSNYPQQTLDDMSYFHFLSANSLVFDLVGESNFLFKEVKALGVGVMGFPELQKLWTQTLRTKIGEVALKLGR